MPTTKSKPRKRKPRNWKVKGNGLTPAAIKCLAAICLEAADRDLAAKAGKRNGK